MIEALRYLVTGWWDWWDSLPTGAKVGMIVGAIVWAAVLAYLMGDGQHYYKQEDGKLFVKEGRLGEWQEIEEHMTQHHNDKEDQ